MANKIDSNRTGLAFAEESSLKTLPGSPTWYELEPNSYADFGGEYSMVSRNPINSSRQRKKGAITDLDASGGYNTDVTQTNLQRLMQGFFFADAREKTKTQPLNGTAITITGVDGTTEDYDAASGLDSFKAGDLVLASNFTVAANNGVKTVSAAAATALTVAEDLTDETPGATAKLENVGFQFPTGDLDITASATEVTLETTTTDCTTLGLIVGEWIGVGGDTAATKFVNTDCMYGRVKSVDTNEIVLDETTATATTETGTGLTIRIWFGTVIKNESDTSLIVRRSVQLERQLGEDANGVQSEYLVGAIPNEFTLNIPQADKLNADLSFVGMDVEYRDGTTGIKSGTRVEAPVEDCFNTSLDIYRSKLYVHSATAINPSALFGYITEANISINNNVQPNKAVSVLGAFDASAGDFEVSGSITAYFTENAAVQAIRSNSDVGLNLIVARENTGFIYDMPLLGLGGGRINVEKDNPVMVPLENNGAECAAGYTLLSTYFAYLPDALMPA